MGRISVGDRVYLKDTGDNVVIPSGTVTKIENGMFGLRVSSIGDNGEEYEWPYNECTTTQPQRSKYRNLPMAFGGDSETDDSQQLEKEANINSPIRNV